MKFKIGDKVRILPSAVGIGVKKSEVGKIVRITKIYSQDNIMITDSRGGRRGDWHVNDFNIVAVVEMGQQLVFDFVGDV